ncbi:hypothetical protein BDP81DRAFT_95591 [Colletotrichum phormii]|uniref:Uncharacterized protein n=1 Tax=Colletotrichum phormii TaxID=359342 RepID=A0AAI9ZJC8_9PEZI|nr:uncharacterized protein BDP81DRAFT_95591 [Colletotrichum phormii]KAK1625342.1 hypothetical protein BDP81DRAFT_95591 [Colletotrichum phormii]
MGGRVDIGRLWRPAVRRCKIVLTQCLFGAILAYSSCHVTEVRPETKLYLQVMRTNWAWQPTLPHPSPGGSVYLKVRMVSRIQGWSLLHMAFGENLTDC